MSVTEQRSQEEVLAQRAREGEEIVRVEGLVKHFPIRAVLFKLQVGQIHAVEGVDLSLYTGVAIVLVGE